MRIVQKGKGPGGEAECNRSWPCKPAVSSHYLDSLNSFMTKGHLGFANETADKCRMSWTTVSRNSARKARLGGCFWTLLRFPSKFYQGEGPNSYPRNAISWYKNIELKGPNPDSNDVGNKHFTSKPALPSRIRKFGFFKHPKGQNQEPKTWKRKCWIDQ